MSFIFTVYVTLLLNLPSVWIPWARRIVIPKAVDISQKIIHLKFLQNATNACSCTDCIESCTPPDFPDVDEDFVIVEGVDGVVFIMVIIFVLGTIIFLAIVAASAALKKNISHCKLFANTVGIWIQNTPIPDSSGYPNNFAIWFWYSLPSHKTS